MKVSPMREIEHEEKSIPPLSQSRNGDMACETLYAHKHVQAARSRESGPAARGIEIHQALAIYIDHLVRTKRATDLEAFDSLMVLWGMRHEKSWRSFGTTTPLTQRRYLPRNCTLSSTKTSYLSSVRVKTGKYASTKGL